MNLSEAIEEFFLVCRVERKSAQTMEGYKNALRYFLKAVGDMDVLDLTAKHIRKFIEVEMRRNPGQSGETLKKRYSVVRAFIRWMYSQEMIPVRLTDFTRAPKPAKSLPHLLSEEQIAMLLRYAKNERCFRDYVIFELFLDTGLRLAEVSTIDLDDVNFEQGYIRVLGKGSVHAIVPIGHRLSRDLYKYIHGIRKAVPGEQAVFVNEFGRRFRRVGVDNMVRRSLAHIGITEKCGAHILRHTFATHFLRKGGKIEELQLILRHTRIETTQIYTHLSATDIISAHRRASPLDHIK